MLKSAHFAGAVAGAFMLALPAAAHAGFDVTPNSQRKTEGRAADFVLSNNCVPLVTCRIHWRTEGRTATAGQDYEASSGHADFNIVTPKTVTITTIDDSIHEYGPETMRLHAIDPGPDPDEIKTATLTIDDNDPRPAIAIGNATVDESESQLTFTVAKPQAGTRAVSVKWATAAGSAQPGSDYVDSSGTVSWGAGQVGEKTVAVPVIGDRIDEYGETVVVNLSDPVDADISDDQGIGTITDEDPAPTVSIGDTALTEGDSGTKAANLVVSLSAPSGKPVSVSYATAAGGTALPGFDFLAKSSTVLGFAPGDTAENAVVQVLGDVNDETDETVHVALGDPVNVSIADGEAIASIRDDDTFVPDIDGDTFDATTDCNDLSPAVHPGAVDVPDNGIDENCDGADTVNLDRDADGANRPHDCDDDDPGRRPGAPDVPANGVDEDCDGVDADYQIVSAGISYQWFYSGAEAWPKRLVVTKVRSGSSVRLRCKGKGCPFKSKQLAGTGKDLDVKKHFKGRKLKRGAKLTIEVAAAGMTSKVVAFRVRNGKAPRGGGYRCRRPGAQSTTACPAG